MTQKKANGKAGANGGPLASVTTCLSAEGQGKTPQLIQAAKDGGWETFLQKRALRHRSGGWAETSDGQQLSSGGNAQG